MHAVTKNMMSNLKEEETEVRRGPWTVEEDNLLIHYISCHGEGHWNKLAQCAGLKRTGKSCRLRWLNYLKPDIKRGNLTPQEQLLILELHSKWGNRWSRIAQHLPGRTDNEIKNYWRTKVQKHAPRINIESNSKRFIDAVRCLWMPRLLRKIKQDSSSYATTCANSPSCLTEMNSQINTASISSSPPPTNLTCTSNLLSENSSFMITSTDSILSDCTKIATSPSNVSGNSVQNNFLRSYGYYEEESSYDIEGLNFALSPESGTRVVPGFDDQIPPSNWVLDDTADTFWNML